MGDGCGGRGIPSLKVFPSSLYYLQYGVCFKVVCTVVVCLSFYLFVSCIPVITMEFSCIAICTGGSLESKMRGRGEHCSARVQKVVQPHPSTLFHLRLFDGSCFAPFTSGSPNFSKHDD